MSSVEASRGGESNLYIMTTVCRKTAEGAVNLVQGVTNLLDWLVITDDPAIGMFKILLVLGVVLALRFFYVPQAIALIGRLF